MILGRVVGEIWGTKKVPNLEGHKLVQVKPLDAGLTPKLDAVVVAVDALGASVGQLVVVAFGSRARDIVLGEQAPFKSFVLAIVDSLETEEATQIAPRRHPHGEERP